MLVGRMHVQQLTRAGRVIKGSPPVMYKVVGLASAPRTVDLLSAKCGDMCRTNPSQKWLKQWEQLIAYTSGNNCRLT